jgi:hypothetical protein
MRFKLEVDIDQVAQAGDPVAELGRILRYWAGNLQHYALTEGDREVIYDSGYNAVGSWQIANRTGD